MWKLEDGVTPLVVEPESRTTSVADDLDKPGCRPFDVMDGATRSSGYNKLQFPSLTWFYGQFLDR